jgi:DNA-binding PadR family transcriptional regulator
MAKRRKVGSLLAVPVLSALYQQPMYPYQVATMLRDRGKDQAVQINWGSFYTVVRNLEKHGFIEPVETVREGRQPERTVYRITEAGQAELMDWLRELIGEPERENTRLEAGLSDAGVLHPDEVISLLRRRLEILDAGIARQGKELGTLRETVPRMFLIESEYHLALVKAEAEWVRGVLVEMEAGALLPEIEMWRRFHDTGELPPEYAEMFEREARKYDQ